MGESLPIVFGSDRALESTRSFVVVDLPRRSMLNNGKVTSTETGDISLYSVLSYIFFYLFTLPTIQLFSSS